MIRIRTTKNAGACLAYFLGDEGLSRREREGVWYGGACAPLGLAAGAPVQARELALLLDGYAANGRSFVQHYKRNRRSAYDLVVSASKPVSVAALCWPEIGEVVRTCFRAAVGGLVEAAERLVRRQGNREKRWLTGSVAAACFTHEASRYGDPHLHEHVLMGNVTYDGEFWALGAEGLFQNHMTLDGVFQRDLAWRLRQAGLRASLERGVAVLPVDPELCRRLSRGRNAIEAAVDRLGVEGPRRKALAQVLNDRLRPRRKAPAPTRRFVRMLQGTERAAWQDVRGAGLQAGRPWGERELKLWLRRTVRESGFETERNRWAAALRASLREPGRDFGDFLRPALDPGLMLNGAERPAWSGARRALGEVELHQAMLGEGSRERAALEV
jgi:conjugative relaxase-like TrwC/TraI family protein